MSNDSSLDWNEVIRVFERILDICNKLQKVFASKMEFMENTDQFSKDETLIEEKSILTQELILGGMKCLVNLILRKMIFLWKIMVNLSKIERLVMKNSLMI
jgi:hypothetical protein